MTFDNFSSELESLEKEHEILVQIKLKLFIFFRFYIFCHNSLKLKSQAQRYVKDNKLLEKAKINYLSKVITDCENYSPEFEYITSYYNSKLALFIALISLFISFLFSGISFFEISVNDFKKHKQKTEAISNQDTTIVNSLKVEKLKE